MCGYSAVAGMLLLALSACSFDAADSGPQVSDEEKAATNLNLGLRYMELGQLETALEKLDHALDLDSGNNEIHDALGVLYERIGKSEEAEEHFQKALSLESDDPTAMNNYGRFLCNKGQYKQGMSYLQQAIAMPLNGRKWFALSNAGICEAMQGNDEQAEQYLRGALQQQPAYAPALLGMVKISYNKAEFMSARAFIERYSSVAGQNAETLWYAVQTERKLGNPKLAEDYRETLLRRFPLSPEAKKLMNVN
ncbi:MAG: type IV pilus biogenesis/stability protein PilW [Gammaproteobacteria bacterium]